MQDRLCGVGSEAVCDKSLLYSSQRWLACEARKAMFEAIRCVSDSATHISAISDALLHAISLRHESEAHSALLIAAASVFTFPLLVHVLSHYFTVCFVQLLLQMTTQFQSQYSTRVGAICFHKLIQVTTCKLITQIGSFRTSFAVWCCDSCCTVLQIR